MASRVLRLVLLVLTSFLALTAFAGGIGLLADINAPPVDMLQGTPFRNYTIPGLALFVIVGGSALAAAYLLLRRHPQAASCAVLSGIAIIGFEVVEVLAIGSDPGVARSLQIFYFALGVLIVGIATASRLTKRPSDHGNQATRQPGHRVLPEAAPFFSIHTVRIPAAEQLAKALESHQDLRTWKITPADNAPPNTRDLRRGLWRDLRLTRRAGG